MAEMRNKFVSWTLNVVKEIKEIPVPSPNNKIYGVGINLAIVQPASSSSSSNSSAPHGRVGVDSVEPTGPAAKAGLRKGDIIVEADGRRFDDGKRAYLPDDVAGAIRGPEGSEVDVVVERDGKRVNFTLTREPIGRAAVSPSSSPVRKYGQERREGMGIKQISETLGKKKKQAIGSSKKQGKASLENRIQGSQKQKSAGGSGRNAEPKKDEKETAVITPEPKKKDTKAATPESPKKDEGETKAVTKECEKAVPPNLLDSLDSLALSEEEHKEGKDLASSAEDADQFDAEPEPHQPRHCCALLDVPSPYAPCAPGRDSVDDVSEEKTAERDEEVSSVMNSVGHSVGDDSQWELISERSGSAIVISLSGSVSGGASFRSPSPSMLKNKFVLTESTGAPYIEHVVLPTDTLQGLCLAYKTSATKLRMENGFSGNSLQMAPKRLRIPVPAVKGTAKSNATGKRMIRTQDRTSVEFKLYAFVAEMPSMELVEAKAYLDLSNWDLDEAIRSAREDEGWSPNGGFDGGGAMNADGISPQHSFDSSSPVTLNAVAKPKALTAMDIYAAPPAFEGDGFELKDIKRREEI